MKTTKPLAFVAMILVLAAAPGAGQVDPIETYLSSVERNATTVVNSAGSQGRGIAMEAAQAALNAIASFRAAYSDLLQESVSAFAKGRNDLFDNIRSASDRLNDYLVDGTTNLDGIAGKLSEAISNVPFGKEIPRVTRVTPVFVAEGLDKHRELIVTGIGLSNSDPVLEYGGLSVRPNTETDSELRFSIPSQRVASGGPSIVQTTLRLFERKRWLLFFSSYVPRTYPIRVAVYPQQLGEYTLTPRRRVSTTETRQQATPEYRCDSPRGEGSHTVAANVIPTQGWTIDTSSIVYERSYSNHGAFTMNTTSPAGFTATLSCSGWGRVVIPPGIVVDQGSIGVEKGTFKYRESRPGSELQDGAPKAGVLQWGNATTVSNLPSDTETVVFNLKLFNGQTSAFVGAGSNPFVTLEFNSASRVVTLTAKQIDQALRR